MVKKIENKTIQNLVLNINELTRKTQFLSSNLISLYSDIQFFLAGRKIKLKHKKVESFNED